MTRIITLQAANGLLVCVEQAGQDNIGIVNARTAPGTVGPWEMINEEEIGDGKVALYVLDDASRKRYFSAQDDGSLVCNRVMSSDGEGLPAEIVTAIGEWEMCKKVQDGTRVGYRFHSGFMCSDLGLPNGRVVANRKEMGPWETFEQITLSSGESSLLPGTWPTVSSHPMQASFCSHKDREGIVVFDPVYLGVYWQQGELSKISDVLSTKMQKGILDVCIAVQGGYRDYLGGQTFDFHAEPQELHDLAAYLLDYQFRPIIYVCTADGGTEKEIYDGTMKRICESVKEFAEHAWFCLGWEVDKDRGGAFTAGQASDALKVMRLALGENAKLCWHGQPNRTTPASYYGYDHNNKPGTSTPIKYVGTPPYDGAWIDADDPSNGSEQGAFYAEGSGFAEIDTVLFQTDHGRNGPSYEVGQPGLDEFNQPIWWNRTLECLDRFLPAGTLMPGAKGVKRRDGNNVIHIHPGKAGTVDNTGYRPPDWFASSRRRGRPTWVLWETVPFEYIRGHCSDNAVARSVAEAEGFGCFDYGCYGEEEGS